LIDRPGYLELRQTASDTYNMLFKIPALGDELRLAIYVYLPEGTQPLVSEGQTAVAGETILADFRAGDGGRSWRAD